MSNVAIILFGENGYDRAAQGVAGAGRGLVKEGGALIAVIVGPPAVGMHEALAQTVDRIVQIESAELDAYQPELALQALTQVMGGLSADVILLGSDVYSQEVTPRLAHRLGGCSIADAAKVERVDGVVQATRSAYGGKATAIYALKKSPVVAWVRARAIVPAAAVGGAAEVESASVQLEAAALTIVERLAEEQEGVRLEDARLIVSGGRGLGGPEPFEQLQALADTIGAEMGASRAACDSGWVPPTWQVGQTGKKVAPEFYLAIAISGASQHLLGMGDSKIVAAINTDPDAPIFRHCSFGIVEDYKNVVPLLTEKLAAMRS